MSGTLYLVATPIGNLGDLSPRGVQTLQEADFIAAEDTRVSMKLLNHFDIKKPLVSYHEHNRAAAGQAILARLLAGETCALVTDAGTPAISDPGEDLVRLCGENGVTVQAIPGCCAAVCALAVSGLPTGRFTFEGFLSANKKERREALTRLAAEQRTMVFHEAPHKLRPTLADMLELGPDSPKYHSDVGAYAASCGTETRFCPDTPSAYPRGPASSPDADCRRNPNKARAPARLPDGRAGRSPSLRRQRHSGCCCAPSMFHSGSSQRRCG